MEWTLFEKSSTQRNRADWGDPDDLEAAPFDKKYQPAYQKKQLRTLVPEDSFVKKLHCSLLVTSENFNKRNTIQPVRIPASYLVNEETELELKVGYFFSITLLVDIKQRAILAEDFFHLSIYLGCATVDKYSKISNSLLFYSDHTSLQDILSKGGINQARKLITRRRTTLRWRSRSQKCR